ncbi:hypothetical protein [Bacillus cereus group sp. TH152-1LC]|uniref:hypothetical protein n=1 Tax=Bacillus cereus group sp. TH152-1LC TaxID=3018060 RepID=UPI0022DF68E7|nr:hypothetical protein [Bacillus cereus group sp. TH152-1LC]MDA1675070.1 hypothetical protein [Bacillus cereus group sp. TH152-1LC]
MISLKQETIYNNGEFKLDIEFEDEYGTFRLKELHLGSYLSELTFDLKHSDKVVEFIKSMQNVRVISLKQETIYNNGEFKLDIEFEDGTFRLKELHLGSYLSELTFDLKHSNKVVEFIKSMQNGSNS